MALSRLYKFSSPHRRRLPSPAPAALAGNQPPLPLPLPSAPFLRPFSTSGAGGRILDSLPPHFEGLCAGLKNRRFSSRAWVDVPSGRVVEVPLAQTGEGIAECELLKWFVNEGDQVEEFQRLCEVQSDKATIEITSRFKGKILHMLYSPGDIVKVGDTLLKMLVADSQGPDASEIQETMSTDSELYESGALISSPKAESAGGVLSTPAVRNLAKQYGININEIHGTGKDGRVLQEDVVKYAASKGTGQETFSPHLNVNDHSHGLNIVDTQHYEDKSIPLRGYQRSMVKSMTIAAKVPHFHYLEEINCDALIQIKAAFQSENSDPNVKHTFLPFLIKSLSMALTKYPLLNSSFNQETNEVILKGCHNIGIAMATSHGLVVPNIKKVQSLTILEITRELARLHHLASNNKLSSEDVTGGTITLSNIGAIGGKFGSPLLNLPEVAIIAIGRIQKLPRYDEEDNVYPASITNVTIGADHRVVDGATVAKFCNEWKLLVEKPELLLLHMR